MEERNFEKRCAIKFCVQLGETGIETFNKQKQAYGEHDLSRSQVFKWFKAFLEGRKSIKDEPRSGRPSTSKTDNNVEIVGALVFYIFWQRKFKFKPRFVHAAFIVVILQISLQDLDFYLVGYHCISIVLICVPGQVQQTWLWSNFQGTRTHAIPTTKNIICMNNDMSNVTDVVKNLVLSPTLPRKLLTSI